MARLTLRAGRRRDGDPRLDTPAAFGDASLPAAGPTVERAPAEPAGVAGAGALAVALPLPGPRSARAVRRRALRRVREGAEPYLYVLPALLSIAIWVYRPLLGTLELSFYQWNLLPTAPRVPVGLENYARVLTLPEMGIALRNTLIYVIGLLPFSLVLPLVVAILVQGVGGRAREAYRAIIFLPVLMAPVVVAVIWRWMLHPVHGVANAGVANLLGTAPVNVFRDDDLAIWAIVGITGWKLLGFGVLIFSAGLAGISQDYVEAAGVDGATRWQVVRYVTLPLLTPTITFVVLLTVLLSGQWTFPLISVLTAGGPLNATTNVYYILWEFGFRNFNVGFSSAAAVLFFAAFGLLALGFTRLMDRFSIHDS
jgi:multiple sugar transport system permease protein